MLVSDTETDRKRHWRAFRSHTAKNGLWLLRSFAAANPRPLFHQVAWLADADTDHARLADDVKQVSAYVDRYGEKRWSEPSIVIDKELAESFLRAAEVLVPSGEVSVREMELWLQHIKPAMRTGRTTVAARAWNDAMVAEGLKQDDRANWAAFLGLNDDQPE